MINYHFVVWEVNDIWIANICANSDAIYTLNDEFYNEKEAKIAAKAFIEGLKFGRETK